MASVTIDPRAVRARVRDRLLAVSADALAQLSPSERRIRVREEIMTVLREERAILPAGAVTDVVNQVSDEVVGLGPIERLLKDPEVSEVMVNGADDIYVERKGRIERVDGLLFEGEEQVFHLIERIVAPEPALARRRSWASSPPSSRPRSGSSPSKMLPSYACRNPTWSRWKRGPRTSRAPAR